MKNDFFFTETNISGGIKQTSLVMDHAWVHLAPTDELFYSPLLSMGVPLLRCIPSYLKCTSTKKYIVKLHEFITLARYIYSSTFMYVNIRNLCSIANRSSYVLTLIKPSFCFC